MQRKDSDRWLVQPRSLREDRFERLYVSVPDVSRVGEDDLAMCEALLAEPSALEPRGPPSTCLAAIAATVEQDGLGKPLVSQAAHNVDALRSDEHEAATDSVDD